ncbi:chloride channel protein [Candidatus Caldatribacterium sp. SIUC1]|uniref:chloride channel protein n=1 Tax=Candidatus Caldatribacterium sp. SIUC1 TaxID=3418365 RepID=UPI003F694B64
MKGVLSGKLQAVWWRILLVKFAGGILGAFGGLSLGREGPSEPLTPQDEADLRYPPEKASPHRYEPYPPETTRTWPVR